MEAIQNNVWIFFYFKTTSSSAKSRYWLNVTDLKKSISWDGLFKRLMYLNSSWSSSSRMVNDLTKLASSSLA